jgi:translocator protein
VENPLLPALGICAVAAALEGVLAGRGIKQRFAELRMPRFSPPLAVWVVIGAAYYASCFVVLYRLLPLPPSRPRTAALALILAVLLANAFWNYLFFRRRSVRLSFMLSIPYSLAAVCLLVLLFELDSVAAWAFLPYVAYLIYANAWGFALLRANSPGAAAVPSP